VQRRDFIRIVITGTVASLACGRERAAGSGPAAPEPDLSGESNAVCHAVRDGRGFTLPKPKRHWRMQRAATRKHMTYTTRTRVRPTAED